MFGLSFTKLIFTALVIVAVWRGFKMFETFKRKLADDEDETPAPRPKARAKARAEPEPQPRAKKTVDLVKCPKCGAYVPNGTICTSKEECTHKG